MKKCICWCLSIIELKNARWNTESHFIVCRRASDFGVFNTLTSSLIQHPITTSNTRPRLLIYKWRTRAQFYQAMYLMCVTVNTRVNKNPSAWNLLSPKPEVTFGTVAIIIRVVLLSPYLRNRAVSLSSIHYNQSHRVYINRRRKYICLIWN